MRFPYVAAAIVARTLSGVSPAGADGFITPFLGFNFSGDSAHCVSLTSCEEKRLNWGVSLGKTGGIFGFEQDIGYAPSFFGKTPTGDNAVLTLMSNLLITVPAGPVQPYGLIGIGLIRPHARFSAASLTTDKNALGYDIGGGVNLFLVPRVGIRGDVRHMRTLQNVTFLFFSGAKLDFWRASAGLTFKF